MADAKRDGNFVPTLLATSSVDGVTPVLVYADPTTHRLLTSSSGGGGTPGGSTTQIQYNNAGAFGGVSGATSDGTNIFIPALYGGSAANDDITIEGTSNGTKTTSYVNLQPTAGFVGIGLTTPTSTLHLNGSFATPYLARTTTTSVAATDGTINCTSGTFNVTLPTAVGITGRQYTIKNSGTGSITVATTSAQTIDGTTTQVLSIQYQSITVQSNGANWIIL